MLVTATIMESGISTSHILQVVGARAVEANRFLGLNLASFPRPCNVQFAAKIAAG